MGHKAKKMKLESGLKFVRWLQNRKQKPA